MTLAAAGEAVNDANFSPKVFKENKKLKYRTVTNIVISI
jgi:hypothetical protein